MELMNINLMISFLKERAPNVGFLNRLKVSYRPLICPFDELLSFVPPGSTVFDIGCGSGQFCLLVAEYTKANVILGIEVSSELVENANELLKGYSDKTINFSVYNGIVFPITLKSADIVFLIDVFHHVPASNQDIFLENIFEMMKPGSTLIFKDIDRANPLVFFNKAHDLLFSSEVGHERTCEDVRSILEKIGFSINLINKRRMYVYPHYTIIAKK